MTETCEGRSIVGCLSGGKYADRPVYILWDGERLPVAAVLDRTRHPDGERFDIAVEDGRRFHLAYSSRRDIWRIEML
jgi:hypothetical protein